MSSSRLISGNYELYIVELCVTFILGDMPHERDSHRVPDKEGLRGEVPYKEVPLRDMPYGISYRDLTPK